MFCYSYTLSMRNAEDVRSVFGNNVKRYRKQKQLSQEQLSEMVSITQKHLSSIESGSAFVSAEVLQSLSSVLEVPVYLLFYNGMPLDESSLPESRIDVLIDEELISVANSIKKRIHELK